MYIEILYWLCVKQKLAIDNFTNPHYSELRLAFGHSSPQQNQNRCHNITRVRGKYAGIFVSFKPDQIFYIICTERQPCKSMHRPELHNIVGVWCPEMRVSYYLIGLTV